MAAVTICSDLETQENKICHCFHCFPIYLPQFKSISSSALSFLYGSTLTSIHNYWKNHSFDYMDLCWQSNVSVFNMLSKLVIAFLPRSKHLLILGLQSPSAVILEPPKIKSDTVSTVSPLSFLNVEL